MTALAKLFRATAFRMTLAILGASALGAGVILGIVAWQVIALVNDQIAQTIEAEANGLSEQYAQGGVRHLGAIIEARSREPGSALYLLTSPAGEPLAGNVLGIPPGVLNEADLVDTPYETSQPSEKGPGRRALARIYALPGGFHLLVGHDLGERARIGAVMMRALATSLIFLAGLGALGALFVARRVLARIDAMNSSTQAIMAGDLAQRLPVSGSGDELDRLALHLNAMLARIGDLMTGLREVSDNIAHDLRTPLTRLRNHAEAALRGAGDAPAHRQALEATIEESDRIIGIFNALLMIARAEAGADRTGMKSFDLGQAARDVVELYEPAAEEKGAALSLSAAQGLMIIGNRELVGQSLANLIDNAIKYGASETAKPYEIQISVAAIAGAVELSVADHGGGVAPADRVRILDRFVRLDADRSRPGSGLGLSLAAAVAHLHGGELRVEDNAPGLRVVMRFAAESPLPQATF